MDAAKTHGLSALPFSRGAADLSCQAKCGCPIVTLTTASPGCPLQSLVDLAGLFRVWNPRFRSWSVWSQVGAAASRTRMCCPVLHRAPGQGQCFDRLSPCRRTTCVSSCWGGTRRGRRTTRPSMPPRACGYTTCTTTCSRTRRPGSGRRCQHIAAGCIRAAVYPESVTELRASYAVGLAP
jgi:hypothetical protein